MSNIFKDYEKVIKCFNSCKTYQHWNSCENLLENFRKKWEFHKDCRTLCNKIDQISISALYSINYCFKK